MGTFRVPIAVGDLEGGRPETVEALVDTGSTYLCLPRPLLESLGIKPVERRPFALGDGRAVEYEVGPVSLSVEGRTFPVLCVFGDPAGEPLLGAVALETFGLAADPIGQRLVPVRGLLR